MESGSRQNTPNEVVKDQGDGTHGMDSPKQLQEIDETDAEDAEGDQDVGEGHLALLARCECLAIPHVP